MNSEQGNSHVYSLGPWHETPLFLDVQSSLSSID